MSSTIVDLHEGLQWKDPKELRHCLSELELDWSDLKESEA